MIRRLALACAVLGLVLGVAQAQDPMDPMDPPMHPEVILGPPEDFHPPEDMPPPEPTGDPEADKAMMLEMFFGFMDADGSGALDLGEFHAWVRGVHMPPPPMHDPMDDPPMDDPPMDDPPMDHPPMDDPPMDHPPMGDEGMEDGILRAGEGDLADLNMAPECSDDLRDSEQLPQAEGIPCGDREGNLIFRTICNMPGYESVAISLPDGRTAACFGLEALRGEIGFEIVREDDGSVVFDTTMGKDAYHGLKVDGPGVYQVRSTGGSPDGAVTIKFVDVPNGM